VNKTVTVEELAADIGRYLAEVMDGETLTVTQEGQEVATISPSIQPKGVPYPFRNFDPGPPPKNLKSDPVKLLREDRDSDAFGTLKS
jgi:prevent-host-death family protein